MLDETKRRLLEEQLRSTVGAAVFDKLDSAIVSATLSDAENWAKVQAYYVSSQFLLETKRACLECLDLAGTAPSRIRIYLDTNVLVALVVPDLFSYNRDVLELARRIGIDFFIIDETLDEFRNLVKEAPRQLELIRFAIKKRGPCVRLSSMLTHYCVRYGRSAQHTQTFEGEMLRELERVLENLSIKLVPSRPIDARIMEEEKRLFAAHGRWGRRARSDIILSEVVRQSSLEDREHIYILATNDTLMRNIKKHVASSPMEIMYAVIDPIYRLRTGGESMIDRLMDTALEKATWALTARQLVFTMFSFDLVASHLHDMNASPRSEHGPPREKCAICRRNSSCINPNMQLREAFGI